MSKPIRLAEHPRALLESLMQTLEVAYTPRDLAVGPDNKACPLDAAFKLGRLSLVQEVRLAIAEQDRRADERKEPTRG